MRYFPLGFDLSAGHCLLVGGGQRALAKARLLDKGGAVLVVVAPDIEEELERIVLNRSGICLRRLYETGDCNNKILVVVTLTDKRVVEQVSTEARNIAVPINAVDQPQFSTVIFTALVERPPLWFAISSDGQVPALTRYWRHRLEEYIAPYWGGFASLLAEFRHQVRARWADTTQRARFWQRALSGQAESFLAADQREMARTHLQKLLSTTRKQDTKRGEVWLVGAGPGNPDLLTLAAARLMQEADVVFYDRLVSDQVLERVRRDALRIPVGKSAGCRNISQEEINAMLLAHVRDGKHVLRLKGGDPFIFARGGEELEYLAHYKVPFRVVPGISAANGCACYAGIPLTDRRYAHSVRFLSGHTKDGELRLAWDELKDIEQTLVFYMSSQRLPELTAGLSKAGRLDDTPVALIASGSMPIQRVLISTLARVADEARREQIAAPSLLIVGDVVRLHKKLNWYGTNNNGKSD